MFIIFTAFVDEIYQATVNRNNGDYYFCICFTTWILSSLAVLLYSLVATYR